ncbi:MAG: tRNA(Ile)(2)-agmatinylcytidine synthase [Candidatus Altiarchaeota archaeon]|nr:tRNA(Ile)(2)-agmatinylcytidine synthase [Candidatus Altiarchaeota archaeon]
MLIGIDDTDSLKGMCTTYIAKRICDEIKVIGYPKLVRLNPNIPYKTRGNGAIAIRTRENLEKVREVVLGVVKKYSMIDDDRTNPGVVFVEESESNKKLLTAFYRRVVSELVSIKEAEDVARMVGAEVFRLKNGRGVIGALAALGFNSNRKSYELISYRVPGNYGKKRMIDASSVFEMNARLYPNVFDSVDLESKKVLITPRGRDPVFCGLRGKSPEYVREAWGLVRPLEEIESAVVFETNQATDDHLVSKRISQVRPYDCVKLDGLVESKPKSVEGGHVVFTLSDGTGSIDCAAYWQTGRFRKEVMSLVPGDLVVACGGIGKYVKTVNLEKLCVTGLSSCLELVVPVCCGRKMTSAGRNKGFKCRKCSKKVSHGGIMSRKVSRTIGVGWFEVPPRARRHLSRLLILD